MNRSGSIWRRHTTDIWFYHPHKEIRFDKKALGKARACEWPRLREKCIAASLTIMRYSNTTHTAYSGLSFAVEGTCVSGLSTAKSPHMCSSAEWLRFLYEKLVFRPEKMQMCYLWAGTWYEQYYVVCVNKEGGAQYYAPINYTLFVLYHHSWRIFNYKCFTITVSI